KTELENTGEWNGELIHTRKDGQEITVTSRWALQRDIWGHMLAVLVINRDITGSKKVEETLRYERELMSVILDNLNSGIILLDNKGVLLKFNKTVQNWYGYQAESEMWKHSSDYVTEFELYDSEGKLVPFENSPIPQAVHGKFVKNIELKLSKKNSGVSRWIDFTTVPVLGAHGEVVRILMGMSDITERKEYEKQVLRKNRLLQYIKDILAEAIRIESEERLGEKYLQIAIDLTGSQYGFIGEIDPEGYLHDIAISDMGWDVCAMYNKTKHNQPPRHFTIHGLYGQVLDLNKSFFTNTPSEHPSHIGVPDGHPPIENFLGVPFIYQGKTIGMIGMANKAGGYVKENIEDLEALAPSIVEGLLRKRADEALRKSEAKFKRIFESNLLAIMFWNYNGVLTDANSALCDILGCTREDVLSGKVSWKDQTPVEIAWRDEQAINEVIKSGVCTPYEKTFIHRDGHHVPVLIGGASIGVEDQAVSYIIDLTQQKNYERSLREAQRVAELRAKEAEDGKRMLDALMENVPEGITICDLDGKIIMTSKYGLKTLGGFHIGMTIDEVVNSWTVYRPDGTVMPTDELPMVRALRNETVKDIEILETNSDGRKLPLLCNAAPIRNDGHVVNGIVVWHDITERKKAEQIRLESERNLEEAQRISHVGSWIWNVKTGKLYCSAETFRIYGEKPFSFQPDLDIFFSYVHPEDREYLKRLLDAQLTGPTKKINNEFRIIRKDGSIRHIHSIGEPKEYNADDETLLIRGTAQDITERKQAEERLREYAKELAAAKRDVESFSYSVSHDLRNPLGLIGGFTGLLVEDYSEKLDEEGRDYLKIIESNVKKMQSLINDILTLSRIGRQEITRTDVNMSATISSYIAELRNTEPDRKVECIIEDNIHVDADPRLIHLALENLLRNSWKFTAQKGTARIEFGTISQNNQLVYFIRDNGVGFDMKFAEKIFEPFKRVHAEKEFGGTGVGLSIAQKVIERHGGRIWAEGEPGSGATFFFTLPV
ncbi:MAG: PAS domain S-box protein, partial [Fibrobacter sp.]|nr:PAS domain S-box protein [Fibrobacter sp.]